MAYVTMFTSKGEEIVVDTLDTNLATWIDMGTGIAEAVKGDNALGIPNGGARVSATQTQPAADTWRHVATIPSGGVVAITEAGVFDASITGNCLIRSNFAAYNLTASDSIEFTFDLQFA